MGEPQEVWGKVSEYLGADSTTRSFQNPYWCPSAPLLRLGFFHFPENWSIVFWRTWWSGSGTPGRCSYWSGGADEGFMGRKTCGAKTGSGRGTNGEACAEEGTDREGIPKPGLSGGGGACQRRLNSLVCKRDAKQHADECSVFWHSARVLSPVEPRSQSSGPAS